MADASAAEIAERTLFAFLAIVHLLPAAGMAGRRSLHRLYGVAVETPELAVLLRHRALQFALLGALSLVAVFVPGVRGVAAAALAISMLGFVLIARSESAGSASLQRIVRVDLFASLLLAIWACWKYGLA